VRLVWHIVRKDLRRFAWPVAAWLALLAIPTLVFRFKSFAIDGHVASSIATTVTLATIWSRLLAVVQVLLGYVIASSLVLEDPLVGTNGFWTTRPISNGRLLAAKLAGAVALFGLLPMAVLTPIWLASGFNVVDALIAAGDFLRFHGIGVLLALMIASLSRNLVQALFSTIVIVAGGLGLLWGADYFASIRFSMQKLMTSTLPIVAGVVLAQQFLKRLPARSWLTLAGAMIALMILQVARPSLFRGAGLGSAPPADTAADRRAKIDVLYGNVSHNPQSSPSLFVTAPWNSEGKYVPIYALLPAPIYAQLPDGRLTRGPHGAGAVESGRRALGFSSESGPLRWQVMMPFVERTNTEPRLAGALELWAVRTDVVGELPLAVGAEASDGSTFTKIVELGRREDRLDEIFLEERDTRARSQAAGFDYFDVYYLIDRQRNAFLHVSGGEMGALEMNSLALRFRRLHVAGDSDWKEGVLIRLRFERERRFQRPFDVGTSP
jgi:hypothetical protein